jgi:hypothetical protein
MNNRIIRYKIVGGAEGEDLRITEADARETLKKLLDEHAAHGYVVKDVGGGDEFVIEDHCGDIMATYELVP